MKRPHKRKPAAWREIARERITILFSEAEKIFHKYPDFSDRYVEIARKISLKYKVPIPREQKRRICKHCYSYLVPGANCRVRLTGAKVVYFCERCRGFMRYPHVKK